MRSDTPGATAPDPCGHRRLQAAGVLVAVIVAHAGVLGEAAPVRPDAAGDAGRASQPPPTALLVRRIGERWDPPPAPAATAGRRADPGPSPSGPMQPAVMPARLAAAGPDAGAAVLRPAQQPAENPTAATGPPAASIAASPEPAPDPDANDAGTGPGAAPAGRPLPTYATRLPGPFERRYAVHRGAHAGEATLRFDSDGQAYTLRLDLSGDGRPVQALTSRGRFDVHGLAPDRLAESHRGRERHAANFDRAAARIRFSGPAVQHELAPGAQDRLSWVLQLAAILQADPARGAGAVPLELSVTGVRGDSARWLFRRDRDDAAAHPDGPDDTGLAGAPPGLVRLVREPERPYDTRAEVWLDPADAFLPWRLRLSHPPAGTVLDLLRRDAAAANP